MTFKKSMFIKPRNTLEGQEADKSDIVPSVPDEMIIACPGCKTMILTSDMPENFFVCPNCAHHFRISARSRISCLVDEDSFVEMDEELMSYNVLDFPGYDKKLLVAKENSGENESVLTGKCRIGGIECALFVMDPNFMMGSMGRVTGEKIARLFEMATHEDLPVVGFAVSGGARIQEGILSLMQMAKTSGAVKYHSDAGNLFVSVLTNPTTGGVVASFAMEGDIILAEPDALIGFAGPRVIEQTMRQQLPEGFQKTEFLLDRGFIDHIVDRREQSHVLYELLKMHVRRELV